MHSILREKQNNAINLEWRLGKNEEKNYVYVVPGDQYCTNLSKKFNFNQFYDLIGVFISRDYVMIWYPISKKQLRDK